MAFGTTLFFTVVTVVWLAIAAGMFATVGALCIFPLAFAVATGVIAIYAYERGW